MSWRKYNFYGWLDVRSTMKHHFEKFVRECKPCTWQILLHANIVWEQWALSSCHVCCMYWSIFDQAAFLWFSIYQSLAFSSFKKYRKEYKTKLCNQFLVYLFLQGLITSTVKQTFLYWLITKDWEWLIKKTKVQAKSHYLVTLYTLNNILIMPFHMKQQCWQQLRKLWLSTPQIRNW